MNWYKIFWLFSIADNLKLVLGWLSGLCLACFFIITVYVAFNKEENEGFFTDMSKSFKLLFFSLFFIGTFSLVAWVLTPSKKDVLVIIVGGAVGNFITTDSSSAQIPKDMTKLLHSYMQNEISQLDFDTKNSLGLATKKDKLVEKAKYLTKEQLLELIQKDTTVQVK